MQDDEFLCNIFRPFPIAVVLLCCLAACLLGLMEMQLPCFPFRELLALSDTSARFLYPL